MIMGRISLNTSLNTRLNSREFQYSSSLPQYTIKTHMLCLEKWLEEELTLLRTYRHELEWITTKSTVHPYSSNIDKIWRFFLMVPSRVPLYVLGYLHTNYNFIWIRNQKISMYIISDHKTEGVLEHYGSPFT